VGAHKRTSSEVKEHAEGVRTEARAEIRWRTATKPKGEAVAKWAVLSRTVWFVPIFWMKEAILEKSVDEFKKLACFMSKTHSRNGSTSAKTRVSFDRQRK